jgi:hypothetical protein
VWHSPRGGWRRPGTGMALPMTMQAAPTPGMAHRRAARSGGLPRNGTPVRPGDARHARRGTRAASFGTGDVRDGCHLRRGECQARRGWHFVSRRRCHPPRREMPRAARATPRSAREMPRWPGEGRPLARGDATLDGACAKRRGECARSDRGAATLGVGYARRALRDATLDGLHGRSARPCASRTRPGTPSGEDAVQEARDGADHARRDAVTATEGQPLDGDPVRREEVA